MSIIINLFNLIGGLSFLLLLFVDIVYYKKHFEQSDWEIIFAKQGRWVNGGGKPTGFCLYEIMYSEKLDKYEMVVSGKDPKFHNTYLYMVEMLNEYKNGKYDLDS